MRILFLLILGSFLNTAVLAQHHHYLFIQSDQQQPFYVRNGSEVLSSSSSGFLIIPRLKDTVHAFIIGFPGEKYPAYLFRFSSYKKDRGMSLKNFEDKGWGLFDLQSMEVIMGEKVVKDEQKEEAFVVPITKDVFTAILASVIDDPGLMGTQLIGKETASYAVARTPVIADVPVQKKEIKTDKPGEKKEPGKTRETEGIVVKTDLPEVITQPAVEEKKTEKKETVAEPEPAPVTAKANRNEEKPSVERTIISSAVKAEDNPGSNTGIKTIVEESARRKSLSTASAGIEKISESSKSGELTLVYLDRLANGANDTVNISIPGPEEFTVRKSDKSDVGFPDVKPSATGNPEVSSSVGKPKKTEDPTVTGAVKSDTTSMVSRSSAIRSDCRRNATDRDIDQVRRKIIAIREEDDMVTAALREFKQKCFTTDQIKSVSFVFVTDQGKYKLLDAAYPYVYDPGNYKSLEHLLNDPYYINRFKALLREN